MEPKELESAISAYCELCLFMDDLRQKFAKSHNFSIYADIYSQYDIRRRELHNEILKLAKKTRKDKEFQYKLAMRVEEYLFSHNSSRNNP